MHFGGGVTVTLFAEVLSRFIERPILAILLLLLETRSIALIIPLLRSVGEDVLRQEVELFVLLVRFAAEEVLRFSLALLSRLEAVVPKLQVMLLSREGAESRVLRGDHVGVVVVVGGGAERVEICREKNYNRFKILLLRLDLRETSSFIMAAA